MISDRTLTKLALKYNSFQKEAQDAPVVEQTPKAPSAQEIEESKSSDLADLFDKLRVEFKSLQDMKDNLTNIVDGFNRLNTEAGARDPDHSIEIYLAVSRRLQYASAQADLIKPAIPKTINTINTIVTYLKKMKNNKAVS